MEESEFWIIKNRGYKKIEDINLEIYLIQKKYSKFLLFDILDKINDLIKFSKTEALEINSDIIFHIYDCIEEALPILIKIIKKNNQ